MQLAVAMAREQPVADTFGGWRLVRKVAESRWFVVYLAAPSSCGPEWPADYVLKFIQPAFARDRRPRQLLQREKQVGCDVAHPHLATVLDADLNHEPPFIVQPFYEGLTVRHLLSGGALSVSRSLWIARQVAEAAQAMHSTQWIHGDIKPDNVITSTLGHATLVDLGFARRNTPQTTRRQDACLETTLAYGAPELFLPQKEINTSIDVYSLGVMLYEMLTGQTPFNNVDPHELVRQQLSSEVIELRRINPGVPLDVSQLVMQMLAKESDQRPTSEQTVRRLVKLEIQCFAL